MLAGPRGDPRAPRDAVAACGEELLALGDDDLRRWAGSAALKRALAEVAGGLEVACEDGAPFVARLPGWNAECRFYPGGGLEGMICSCHAGGPCPHKLAAVIAWQARSGRRDLVHDEALLAEAEGAPRTREDVRVSVQRTLGEVIALGLSRLSPAAEGRLRTLATSAHGVDLSRLERLLRAVADEISGWLRREARASSAALLARAAQAIALADALAAPTPALVGRHRSRYERVGELELVGMGRIEAAFQRIWEYQFARVAWLDAAERYVASGDRGELERVSPTRSGYLFGSLAQAIAPPPEWSEADRRALHVLAAAQLLDVIGGWLDDALANEKEDEDRYGLVRAELAAAGVDGAAMASLTARRVQNTADTCA